MVRLTLRRVMGVLLLAALAAGCLGGQTGQPSSATCEQTEVSPSASWSNTTVELAAQAFEGTYSAGLRWQVEPRGSNTQTPVELEDSLQLTITYGGTQAKTNICGNQLSVPVSVMLTTSASGVADTAEGTLSIERAPQGLVANLYAESTLIRLHATLQEAALGAAPDGSFDALDANQPGASAIFTKGPP